VIFERSSGLRVTTREEIAGLDQTYWGVTNFGDEHLRELGPDGTTIPKDGASISRANGVASAPR
jgi:hypothetical protein